MTVAFDVRVYVVTVDGQRYEVDLRDWQPWTPLRFTLEHLTPRPRKATLAFAVFVFPFFSATMPFVEPKSAGPSDIITIDWPVASRPSGAESSPARRSTGALTIA